MKALRKVIGLLIIIFIGGPLLMVTIWTVGITNAVVSPEFISEVPQRIIADVPDLLDEFIEEAQDRSLIEDENVRLWFRAVSRADTSPKVLMKEIGVQDWLENELSLTLDKIGDVLRGRRRARTLTLDMRPLKKALSHPALDNYITSIVKTFPPCDEDDYEEWREALYYDKDFFDLPACQPEPALMQSIIEARRWGIEADIPDEVEIFEDVRFPTFGISRFVSMISYGMFLIPAFFLFIGALIAATSPGGFFRWLGVSILIGGLIALGLAFITGGLADAALNFAYTFSDADHSGLEQLALEKTSWFQEIIIDHLFIPVQKLAGWVCLVGVVILAGSFLASGPAPRRTASTPPVKRTASAPVSEQTEAAPSPEPSSPETAKKEKPEEPPQ